MEEDNELKGQKLKLESTSAKEEEEVKAREKVMQTELILKLIAKKMEMDDLWTLRQTDSLWNHNFILALRDKQEVLTLTCGSRVEVDQPDDRTYGDNNQDRPKQKEINHVRSIQNYTNLMRSSKEIPNSKFALIDAHTNAAPSQEFADFFRVCGAFITRLDLLLGPKYKTPMEGETKMVNISRLRRIIFDQVPHLTELRIVPPTLLELTVTLLQRNEGVMDKDIDLEHMGERMGVLTRDLPNLRRLALCCPPEYQICSSVDHLDLDHLDLDSHSSFRNFLADLLRHAPELDSLELGNKSEMKNVDVFTLLRDVLPMESLPKLKTLKIYKLDVMELKILLDLAGRVKNPLRLQTFFTSIDYPCNLSVELVQLFGRFLELQSDTLRHFSLDTPRGFLAIDATTTSKISLPALPLVTRFCLKVKCNGFECLPFGTPAPQTLEEIFPALESYEYINKVTPYEQDEDGEEDDMNGFGYSGSSLTDLSLDTCYPKCANRFREIYGHRFQLLLITRLEISLQKNNANLFRQICANMPALQVLHIKCSVYYAGIEDGALKLDDLLSGVPDENLRYLKEGIEMMTKGEALTLGRLRSYVEEYKTEAGLSDLVHLKKLVIVASSWEGYLLSDIGGYFGLALASPTLQHISIEAEPKNLSPYASPQKKKKNPGNLLSVQCEAMIRSIMSPPAMLHIH